MRFLISAVLALSVLGFLPDAAAGQADEEFQEIGAWMVRVSVDPMTDEETSMAILVNDNERGSLGLRCVEAGFDLMVSTGFTVQIRDRSGVTTLAFSDLDPEDTREALSHLRCAQRM